jgi:hypothetical protein
VEGCGKRTGRGWREGESKRECGHGGERGRVIELFTFARALVARVLGFGGANGMERGDEIGR